MPKTQRVHSKIRSSIGAYFVDHAPSNPEKGKCYLRYGKKKRWTGKEWVPACSLVGCDKYGYRIPGKAPMCGKHGGKESLKFCNHGRLKWNCRECGGSAYCEHGKRRRFCRDCGGSSFCEHGKRKQNCRKCGGSNICPHGKHKQICRECGGSAFCEHGKAKQYCRDCGGSSFCKHGKYKRACRKCGGSALCEHGKHKEYCRECGGSQICEHGKQKRSCRKCGGSAFCEHGKHKGQCRQCGGSAFCEHDRRKSQCCQCGGSAFCVHDKRKNQCRECGGSVFCVHGKQKHRCADCIPLEKLLASKRFCSVCGVVSVNPRKRTICAQCDETAKTRTEHVVWAQLEPLLHFPPSSRDDVLVGARRGDTCNGVKGGCGQRRPDASWVMDDRVVYLEIDEDSHADRTISCELAKIDDTAYTQAMNGKTLRAIFVRFNPDAYDGARVPLNERVRKLANVICHECTAPLPLSLSLKPKVMFMYYHSKAQTHIEAHRSHFEVMKIP